MSDNEKEQEQEASDNEQEHIILTEPCDILIYAIASQDLDLIKEMIEKGAKLEVNNKNERIFEDIVDEILPRNILDYMIDHFKEIDVDNYLANSLLRDAMYYDLYDHVDKLLRMEIHNPITVHRFSTFGRISEPIRELCQVYAANGGKVL